MTRRTLDDVRLAVGLLVTIIAAVMVLLATIDPQALPVGAVYLTLLVASQLTGVYRFADVGALLCGSIAYAFLEQGRGLAGAAAWAAATASMVAALIAVRVMDARTRAAEQRAWRMQEVVDELTIYDAASELLKPRYGELALQEEVARARRTNTPLTLILISPDPTTDYALDTPTNEDDVAQSLGGMLRACLRITDRGARLAPLQFAAILPATGASAGTAVAAKISSRGEQLGRPVRCAVAAFPDHAASADDLLAEAQSALQLARAAGLSVLTPAMLHRLETAT